MVGWSVGRATLTRHSHPKQTHSRTHTNTHTRHLRAVAVLHVAPARSTRFIFLIMYTHERLFLFLSTVSTVQPAFRIDIGTNLLHDFRRAHACVCVCECVCLCLHALYVLLPRPQYKPNCEYFTCSGRSEVRSTSLPTTTTTSTMTTVNRGWFLVGGFRGRDICAATPICRRIAAANAVRRV